MKKSLLAILLGSSMALAACGGDEEAAPEEEKEPATEETTEEAPAETADASAGQEVYNKSCMSCHGGNLEGGMGPALDKIGADKSKDDILGVIKNGQGQMPPNVVQGEDAEAVAEWLAAKK
ncbi:cytochrome c551 [Bacillus ectoiniformans]|uniref:cytochrome c551 n=1 Tax=Bacillus ectoiniformans TaxID=1494429 RepID=UPI001EF85823|nr:cytochrome c [Bacillus ectoiniformans]